MKKMKISAKLICSFSTIIVMILILGIVSMLTLTTAANVTTKLYGRHIVGVEYLVSAAKSFEQVRVRYSTAGIEILLGNEKTADEMKKATFDKINETDVYFQKYAAILDENDKEIKQEFNRIINLRDELIPKIEEFFSTFDTAYDGDTELFIQKMGEMTAVNENIEKIIDKFIQLENKSASEASGNEIRYMNKSKTVQIIVLAVIILSSILITAVISLGIKKDLRILIVKLLSSSNSISGSIHQLSDASGNLAQGSSEQAASIEETSATMNENESMIKQTAENTRLVAGFAVAHIDAASNGVEKAERMIDFMERLGKSSAKINEIVSTINSIALQTTILSLNASVESVRAGEAGKSFNVVAEEVRSLARKSTAAAESTAIIIEENIQLAKQGFESSVEMVEDWRELKAGAEKAAQLLGEIATAAEEQARGSHQVNIAMSQIETVTQETASVAEENAALSSSMEHEADNLKEAVEIAQKMI